MTVASTVWKQVDKANRNKKKKLLKKVTQPGLVSNWWKLGFDKRNFWWASLWARWERDQCSAKQNDTAVFQHSFSVWQTELSLSGPGPDAEIPRAGLIRCDTWAPTSPTHIYSPAERAPPPPPAPGTPAGVITHGGELTDIASCF